MNSDSEQTFISDASKPNAGRMYDYLLGGNHNFEIDRKMGEQFKQVAPFITIVAKCIRWFLGEAIRQALERGFTQFLDFASGLPTVDHIHSSAPRGTKVVYSDIDPITAKYANTIIGENPDVKYMLCDAGKPESLIESDTVKTLFKDNHKVAIGFNGICYFLSDEQISHAMNVLYDWADEGSIIFLIDYDSENITKDLQAIIDLYSSMSQYVGVRTKNQFKEIIEPWKVDEPGFLPLEKWIEMSPAISDDTQKSWGGGFFAGFLKK
ncbi:MAG: SAM-dependent methyltransferase [Spirochaetales bacterium]|nr:SAM-dependent methyltransferase [Spirochaetales bacterium]